MQTLNLIARNNNSFQFTRDLSAWVVLLGSLSSATFRAAIRNDPSKQSLKFSSVANEEVGQILFDAGTSHLKMVAPFSAVRGMTGNFTYDVQVNVAGFVVDLFGGSISFADGATLPK